MKKIIITFLFCFLVSSISQVCGLNYQVYNLGKGNIGSIDIGGSMELDVNDVLLNSKGEVVKLDDERWPSLYVQGKGFQKIELPGINKKSKFGINAFSSSAIVGMYKSPSFSSPHFYVYYFEEETFVDLTQEAKNMGIHIGKSRDLVMVSDNGVVAILVDNGTIIYDQMNGFVKFSNIEICEWCEDGKSDCCENREEDYEPFAMNQKGQVLLFHTVFDYDSDTKETFFYLYDPGYGVKSLENIEELVQKQIDTDRYNNYTEDLSDNGEIIGKLSSRQCWECCGPFAPVPFVFHPEKGLKIFGEVDDQGFWGGYDWNDEGMYIYHVNSKELKLYFGTYKDELVEIASLNTELASKVFPFGNKGQRVFGEMLNDRFGKLDPFIWEPGEGFFNLFESFDLPNENLADFTLDTRLSHKGMVMNNRGDLLLVVKKMEEEWNETRVLLFVPKKGPKKGAETVERM